VVEENELVLRPTAEGKKKIPGEGGGCFGLDRFRVRFSLFLCCLSQITKCPPLCLSCGPVFIGKMLHGSQNWSLNFLFCKFDFS